MRRLRTILALSGALLAAGLVAPPVGAWEEGVNSGKTAGDENTGYSVPDSPGVVCRFENHPGVGGDELNRVKIKRVHSHGRYANDTWVGFRFLIKRNVPPFGDGEFRTVFRSPVQKKQANNLEVAFFRGGWTAPEGANGRYRVHLLFYYYEPGSRTHKEESVRGLVEVYRHSATGETAYDIGSDGDAGYCQRNFHGL